jgi:hypothetical protein
VGGESSTHVQNCEAVGKLGPTNFEYFANKKNLLNGIKIGAIRGIKNGTSNIQHPHVSFN